MKQGSYRDYRKRMARNGNKFVNVLVTALPIIHVANVAYITTTTIMDFSWFMFGVSVLIWGAATFFVLSELYGWWKWQRQPREDMIDRLIPMGRFPILYDQSVHEWAENPNGSTVLGLRYVNRGAMLVSKYTETIAGVGIEHTTQEHLTDPDSISVYSRAIRAWKDGRQPAPMEKFPFKVVS